MPVDSDEAALSVCRDASRHRVQAFRGSRMPEKTRFDGLAVTEVEIACSESAEEGRTIALPRDRTDFVPAVAGGAWRG